MYTEQTSTAVSVSTGTVKNYSEPVQFQVHYLHKKGDQSFHPLRKWIDHI